MSRFLVLGSLLALSALAACEGAEAKPAPANAPQKMQASHADHDLCVAFITHARTCTDAFIPALVDARAEADHPAGIKAEVAKDRDGVIAQAKTEWATDSDDAHIEQMCTPENIAAHSTDDDRQKAASCNASADCAAYTACALPVFKARWAH